MPKQYSPHCRLLIKVIPQTWNTSEEYWFSNAHMESIAQCISPTRLQTVKEETMRDPILNELTKVKKLLTHSLLLMELQRSKNTRWCSFEREQSYNTSITPVRCTTSTTSILPVDSENNAKRKTNSIVGRDQLKYQRHGYKIPNMLEAPAKPSNRDITPTWGLSHPTLGNT